MDTCPDCGSDFTRRIARSWWMRLLSPYGRHIHCSRCDERSWVFRRVEQAAERPLLRRVRFARRPL